MRMVECNPGHNLSHFFLLPIIFHNFVLDVSIGCSWPEGTGQCNIFTPAFPQLTSAQTQQYLNFFFVFRAIMQDVSNDNRVLSLVAQSGIRNTLVTLLDQLQRCQKSLNEFLEVLLQPKSHTWRHCKCWCPIDYHCCLTCLVISWKISRHMIISQSKAKAWPINAPTRGFSLLAWSTDLFALDCDCLDWISASV